MSEQARCKNCGVGILQYTYDHHGGRCVPCWRIRPSALILEGTKITISIVSFFLFLPFTIARAMLRCAGGIAQRAYWEVKFPFSNQDLMRAIEAVHPNRAIAKRYYWAVIEGYCSHHPEITGLEPVDAATWNLNHLDFPSPEDCGRADGSLLRRQEIEFYRIPTWRKKLDDLEMFFGSCDVIYYPE